MHLPHHYRSKFPHPSYFYISVVGLQEYHIWEKINQKLKRRYSFLQNLHISEVLWRIMYIFSLAQVLVIHPFLLLYPNIYFDLFWRFGTSFFIISWSCVWRKNGRSLSSFLTQLFDFIKILVLRTNKKKKLILTNHVLLYMRLTYVKPNENILKHFCKKL